MSRNTFPDRIKEEHVYNSSSAILKHDLLPFGANSIRNLDFKVYTCFEEYINNSFDSIPFIHRN